MTEKLFIILWQAIEQMISLQIFHSRSLKKVVESPCDKQLLQHVLVVVPIHATKSSFDLHLVQEFR